MSLCQLPHPSKIWRKPRFLLLEVMIAFFLVALCALPLMQPQFAILTAERGFVRGVTLDRLVNNLYAEVLLRFYRGEISWASIGSRSNPQTPIPITNAEIAALGYKGSYTLRILPYANKRGEYSRGGKTDPYQPANKHLLEIEYTFTAANEEPLKFTFWLFVETVTETSRAAPKT